MGHLGWFGQNFRDNQYARGPAEAAGVGVELEANEIALRFNFCHSGLGTVRLWTGVPDGFAREPIDWWLP